MESSAIISEDRLFRVRLLRRWRPERPLWLWIMLNPSTAGEIHNDATIRRLIGFTERGQGGGFIVENLFSFRAPDPLELVKAADPIGPDCDASLITSLIECDGPVVCAWGNNGGAARPLIALSMILRAGREPMCLGLTGQRKPMHPVRLPYGLELVRLSDAMEDFDVKGQTRTVARKRG